jgi:hypothetical protein
MLRARQSLILAIHPTDDVRFCHLPAGIALYRNSGGAISAGLFRNEVKTSS